MMNWKIIRNYPCKRLRRVPRAKKKDGKPQGCVTHSEDELEEKGTMKAAA